MRAENLAPRETEIRRPKKPVPIPYIEIPELPPIDRSVEPEVHSREAVIEKRFQYNGQNFVARIEVGRREETGGDPRIIGHLYVEIFTDQDSDYPERVSSFKAGLNRGRDIGYAPSGDYEDHTFWRVYNRRVRKDMRGQGFGTFNVRLMEDAMEKMAAGMHDVDPEWIVMSTRLGSLSNMIVDRDWLEEYVSNPQNDVSPAEMDRFAERLKNPQNLGYVLHPKDVDRALYILRTQTEEQEELKHSYSREAVFIKSLTDDLVDDIFAQ